MLNKGGISMNIGLALIPSKSFQDEVNGYRKRYDTEYAYHSYYDQITL